MARRRANAQLGTLTSAGFAGGGGGIARQLYGLGLLLLAMLFFMLTFRGKVPHVIERVFATKTEVTDASLQERRELVAQQLGGAWHDPADGTPFLETPGYSRLLGKLIDHVRPGEIVANPPLFDRNLAMSTPEVQRSETVKVRGVVVKHWAEKLERPVFQLQDVWRVFLTDGDGDDGIVVDLVERPPVLREQRDLVEVTGSFYRLVKYETVNGRKVEIPYLLARSLVVVPDAQPTNLGFDSPAIAIVFVGLAAMVVWGIVRVISSRAKPQRIRWRAPHLS